MEGGYGEPYGMWRMFLVCTWRVAIGLDLLEEQVLNEGC